jgi:hypothetical protein
MAHSVFRKNAVHPSENRFEVGEILFRVYIAKYVYAPTCVCGATDKAHGYSSRGPEFETRRY